MRTSDRNVLVRLLLAVLVGGLAFWLLPVILAVIITAIAVLVALGI